MSRTQWEFEKFLKEKEFSLTEYEKKLSNIILANFNAIESLGSAGGKRGKFLAKLVNEIGASISAQFIFEDNIKANRLAKQVRLSKIKVKNFRGFSDELILEFKNQYTFVFGPNGTGKSSLCEALEFCLLGTILEAEAKRIDISNYITNAITGQREEPILMGVDVEGNEDQVKPDFPTYEFCFLESSRITGFARVSANTAQAQQQRLATLFGLEDFNNFVSQFNERFDYEPLDCIGIKAAELKLLEETILVQKDKLTAIPTKRNEIEKKIEFLFQRFPIASTIEDLRVQITGDANTEWSINNLTRENIELSKVELLQDPGIIDITVQLQSIKRLMLEQELCQLKLSSFKSELSLRDLYSAILNNKSKFDNICPACESPLYKESLLLVPADPFLKAESMLKNFQEAIELETGLSRIKDLLNNELNSLKTRLIHVYIISQKISFSEKDKLEKISSNFDPMNSNKSYLESSIQEIEKHIPIIELLKSSFDNYNQTAKEAKQKIGANNKRITELQSLLQELSDIDAALKICDIEEQTATKSIDDFYKANISLIQEVEKEKQVVSRNILYRDAYYSLKEKLSEYNSLLPSRLVADLNSRTLEIYNQINRYDPKSDLLVSLELPIRAGEKIKIKFANSRELDALHVLSEGHLRCLGLAILLAKNIHDNLPFIIFDDVVNAIDDEHRRGIVETIRENEDISTKQLILTTHGEEFVKLLENSIPKSYHSKLVTRIDFLEQLVPKKISIKHDLSRNYLVLAAQRYIDGQIRDSLANCRRALESLLNLLWRRLSNRNFSVQVSVRMRSPNHPPELMSVATGLYRFITKNKIEEFYPVSEILEFIIGIESKYPLEWSILNKGTHDEDRSEEFDRATVKIIIELLEQLDDVMK